MINSSGNTPVAILIGISLFLLLVICVIGCFWRSKRHNLRKLTFPSILQTERNRKPSSSSPTNSTQKMSVPTANYVCAGRETKIDSSYENVKVGPLKAEEGKDEVVYENSRQPNFEDHIYGNETPFDANLEKSGASEESQDEDIYILPDKY